MLSRRRIAGYTGFIALILAIDDCSKLVYYVGVISITYGALNHVEQVIQ